MTASTPFLDDVRSIHLPAFPFPLPLTFLHRESDRDGDPTDARVRISSVVVLSLHTRQRHLLSHVRRPFDHASRRAGGQTHDVLSPIVHRRDLYVVPSLCECLSPS
nr:hypothetical protein CFP56_42229 [Quercus suber]